MRCLGWGSLSRGFFFCFFAEASQEIFKIASMAPGALLLEAQKEYEVLLPHSYLPLRRLRCL